MSNTFEVPVVGGTLLMAMYWALQTVHVQNHSLVWSMGHGPVHPLNIQAPKPFQVLLFSDVVYLIRRGL